MKFEISELEKKLQREVKEKTTVHVVHNGNDVIFGP